MKIPKFVFYVVEEDSDVHNSFVFVVIYMMR